MFRPGEKKNEAMLREFFASPDGMAHDIRLSALSGPFSGTFGFAADRLLQPSVQVPRSVRESIHDTMSSLRTKALTELPDKICESAERLHATSFHSKNLAKCAELNGRAMEQLIRAIAMDSVRARACFADMLLTGNTVGVKENLRFVTVLVCQDPPACKLAYNDDPDCKGVLAHYCVKNGLSLKVARKLADESAAAGSKYGQLVLGLLLEQGSKPDLATNFQAAAAHNYDEAQIALSELYLNRGNKDEALRLLNLAAEQGNKNAFFSIAQIYKSDAAQNERSFREAERWFKLAHEAGHPYAEDTLKGMKIGSGFGRG
jgi:TPR repeat protein